MSGIFAALMGKNYQFTNISTGRIFSPSIDDIDRDRQKLNLTGNFILPDILTGKLRKIISRAGGTFGVFCKNNVYKVKKKALTVWIICYLTKSYQKCNP